jgi:hypothetical protein
LADQGKAVTSAPKVERSLADQAAKPKAPFGSDPGAADTKAEVTEAKRVEAERRKYRLKVDGQDVEEELTDEQIAVRLQKAHGAERRMQEAAEERKQLKAWIEAYKKDPFAASKDPYIGLDLEELAEQRLTEKYTKHLEEQSMTEEQRELRRRDEEIAQIKAERDEYRRQETERAQAQLDERIFKETNDHFTSALEELGVDASNEAMYEMASIAKLNLERNLQLTPKQLAAEVRDRIEGRQEKLRKSVTGGMKGDRLLKHLGADVVKEVIRASLAERKVNLTPKPAAPRPPAAAADEKPGKSISPSQFRRKNLYGIG